MEPSKITALIPIMNGPAKGCMVVYEDGRRCRRFCSVERYMNTLAAFMGNDNRACRKLFDRKRGTGILLNDGSIFVQIRMTDRVPTLGYVRLDAIRGRMSSELWSMLVLHRRQRKMRPPPGRGRRTGNPLETGNRG